MKLPEDEIKERFYKGEITFQEAKKQLENLITFLSPVNKSKSKDEVK